MNKKTLPDQSFDDTPSSLTDILQFDELYAFMNETSPYKEQVEKINLSLYRFMAEESNLPQVKKSVSKLLQKKDKKHATSSDVENIAGKMQTFARRKLAELDNKTASK